MPKSPARCSNLKEELRLLRAELSTADKRKKPSHADAASTLENDRPIAVTPPSHTASGMPRWGTGSSSMFDDGEASPSSSTAQCTPEKVPVAQSKGTKPSAPAPSVHQNRFHKISDEGCEELKQSGLKKAASRSPTALGVSDGAGSSTNGASSSNAASTRNPQKFRFLLVTDFECTCDSGEPNYPHEIIEFPVVVVDTRINRPVAEFHTYIRPVRNPQLTSFCTELTGITQDMVQDAPTLPEALLMFDEWVRAVLVPLVMAASPAESSSKKDESEAIPEAAPSSSSSSAAVDAQAAYDSIINVASPCPAVMFMTDSPTDMRHFMYNCHVIRDSIAFPPIFYQWLNVRRAFADHFRVKPEHLMKMLRRLGMQFHGQHHSGIDDARNIARVAMSLIQKGHRLLHVSKIPFQTEGQLESQRRASDLLMELGDDCDVGAARGHRGGGDKSKKPNGNAVSKKSKR
jgi:ERI1 exoribonuclease 3